MKWTEAKTMKFVELYHGFECFRNLSSLRCKNKQMTQTTIENLVKDMGKEGFGFKKAKQKIFYQLWRHTLLEWTLRQLPWILKTYKR